MTSVHRSCMQLFNVPMQRRLARCRPLYNLNYGAGALLATAWKAAVASSIPTRGCAGGGDHWSPPSYEAIQTCRAAGREIRQTCTLRDPHRTSENDVPALSAQASFKQFCMCAGPNEVNHLDRAAFFQPVDQQEVAADVTLTMIGPSDGERMIQPCLLTDEARVRLS